MSIASDKLETIRQQVQYHLDHEAQKQLSPAQENELREQIKARLVKENAVIVAHYYTARLPVGAGDVRYFVEAEDNRGNVSRSALERVYLA